MISISNPIFTREVYRHLPHLQQQVINVSVGEQVAEIMLHREKEDTFLDQLVLIILLVYIFMLVVLVFLVQKQIKVEAGMVEEIYIVSVKLLTKTIPVAVPQIFALLMAVGIILIL